MYHSLLSIPLLNDSLVASSMAMMTNVALSNIHVQVSVET